MSLKNNLTFHPTDFKSMIEILNLGTMDTFLNHILVVKDWVDHQSLRVYSTSFPV